MYLPVLLVWETWKLHFPDAHEAKVLDARKFYLWEAMAQDLEGGDYSLATAGAGK